MTLPHTASAPWRSWENFLALLILGSVVYASIHLYLFNYLPQPFFYEPSDTYADWFNTAFWARDKGTYDVWQTLYPPLSFVFLRLLSFDRCYPETRAFDYSAGLAARDCDWIGIVAIWGIWLLNAFLAYKIFRRIDRRTAVVRTICLSLGWPMLDGIERGNLVLVSFTFFMLAFAPLLKSSRMRCAAAGIAINFKVYLIAALIPLLLKRKWRFVEMSIIATFIVYAISYAILGRGTPVEIYEGLANWSTIKVADPLDMWFSTTYQALLRLLSDDLFPTLLILGSRQSNILLIVIPTIIHLTQALIICAAIAAWVRPEAVPARRIVLLGVMLALITSESGGYTPIYYILFILMEPWEGFARKYAIVMCYLIGVSYDFPISPTLPFVSDTYFRGSTVIMTFYITLLPFLRPMIIMSMAWAVAAIVLKEVWNDIQSQGWRTRWRFRHDFPIMVGKGEAIPPGRTA